MTHKIRLYDVKKGFDAPFFRRPVHIVETDDPMEARRIATQAIAEAQSTMAANIDVDWRLCETLQDFLALNNACAAWLLENPIRGDVAVFLTDNLEHWADYGVTTPEQMKKHLLLENYSDAFKERYGSRTYGHGMGMFTPIEEIEAAWDSIEEVPPALAIPVL